MPPIRIRHVLIECPYEGDCEGSVFQSYSRHCLVDHPYDIRYRGTAVLNMRAHRWQEQWALEDAARPRRPHPANVEEQESDNDSETTATLFPIEMPSKRQPVQPVKDGCLEPVSQLAILPHEEPPTAASPCSNYLQLSV